MKPVVPLAIRIVTAVVIQNPEPAYQTRPLQNLPGMLDGSLAIWVKSAGVSSIND